MIGISPDTVSKDIAAIRALSQFNDHIRTHFLDETDLSTFATEARATNYTDARSHLAEAIQWRVFAHCAAVTRLYALYEGFVYELISAWLKIVPDLYASYSELPDAIVNQHRIGIGTLLQKLGGGPRTEGLTELRIVQSLYSGLSGGQAFELVTDAFFIDLRNLRYDELCSLFKRVSLDNLGGWLEAHIKLKALCDAAGTTTSAQLKELVEFRNEASHARQDINETLGVSAFQDMAEFVQMLCVALHQFVVFRYVDILQESGRLERLGQITEYFSRPDASILTTTGAVQISLGEDVIARGDRYCVPTRITSLQDHGVDVESISAIPGSEVGIRFDPTANRVGLQIDRLRPVLSNIPATLVINDEVPVSASIPLASLDSSSEADASATADGSSASPQTGTPSSVGGTTSRAGRAWSWLALQLGKWRQWLRG